MNNQKQERRARTLDLGWFPSEGKKVCSGTSPPHLAPRQGEESCGGELCSPGLLMPFEPGTSKAPCCSCLEVSFIRSQVLIECTCPPPSRCSLTAGGRQPPQQELPVQRAHQEHSGDLGGCRERQGLPESACLRAAVQRLLNTGSRMPSHGVAPILTSTGYLQTFVQKAKLPHNESERRTVRTPAGGAS